MNDDIMSRDKKKKEIPSSNFSLEDIFPPAGATGGTVDRRQNIDSGEENNAPSDQGLGTGAENPELDIEKREHVTPCNKNADPSDENDHIVSNTTTQENEPPKEENQIELTSKLEKQLFSNSDNNAQRVDAATKMQEEKIPACEKHAVQLYGTQNSAVASYHVSEQATVQSYTEDNKPTFPPVPSADLSKHIKGLNRTRAHGAHKGLPGSHDKKSLMQDTTSTSKRSYTSTKCKTDLTNLDCVNGIGAASQDRLPSDASSSGAQLENTPETRGEREHRDAEDPPCKTHNSQSVFPQKVTETKEHITDSINVGVPIDTNVPSDEMPQTDASNTSNSGNADSCEGETLHGNRLGEDTDDTSELIAASDSLASAASDTQRFPELPDNSANDSGVDSGGNLSTFEERDSLANLHLIGGTSSVNGNQEHTSQQSNSPASDPWKDGHLTTIPIWRSSLQGTSMALPEWSATSPFTVRLLVQLDLLLQRTDHFVVNLPAVPGFLSTHSGTVYEGSIMSYSVNDLNILEDPQELPDEVAVGGLPTVSVASYNIVTTTSTFTPTTTTVTTASATVTTIATTTTVSSTYRDSFESATHMGIRHSPRISIVPLTSQPRQYSSTPGQPAAPWPAVRHRQPIYVPSLGPLVLLRWEFEVHDRANMGHRNTTVNLADGEELPDDTDLTPVQSEEEDPQELPDEVAVGGLPIVSVASYNVVTTTSTFTSTTTTVTTASATLTTIATITTVSSTYRDSFESATQMGIRHSPRISIVPLTSQPQQESSSPGQPAAPWPAVRHRQPIYVPDLGPLVLLRWEFEVHDRANVGHRNTTVNLADGEELPDDTDLTPVQSEEGNNSPLEFNIADDLEIIDGNDDASQDAANTTGDREVSSNVLMELLGVPTSTHATDNSTLWTGTRATG